MDDHVGDFVRDGDHVRNHKHREIWAAHSAAFNSNQRVCSVTDFSRLHQWLLRWRLSQGRLTDGYAAGHLHDHCDGHFGDGATFDDSYVGGAVIVPQWNQSK